jgi:post-segregation antitoxin (ccd killing protein)
VKQIQEDLPQEKEDNEHDPEGKKSALTGIIAEYNRRFGTNHTIGEFDLYFQDVQKRIKDQQWPNAHLPHAQKIDITIVVDMLLTGFDSKYLNTLYVDKNLKHHGLIQAFSRTNRVLNGTKPYGNILDFRQQQDAVDAAITLFSGEKTGTQAREIWLVDKAPVVIEKLQGAVQKLDAFMKSQGLDCAPEAVPNLKGDEARSAFIMGEDVRFKNYGLAPKSAADFAFLLHGFHFLKDEGVMAIILPHGVLFRGGAEERIRTKLLKDGHIDTVIGLPANLFYSTGIPVCILVLKKCKKPDDVLFINAAEHFVKGKRQNQLAEEHIDKIIDTYQHRKPEDRYSKCVTMQEIAANNYNLNISRYISTAIAESEIDLAATHGELVKVENAIQKATAKHNGFLKELGLSPLPTGGSEPTGT